VYRFDVDDELLQQSQACSPIQRCTEMAANIATSSEPFLVA
jgi:hypothetical protein